MRTHNIRIVPAVPLFILVAAALPAILCGCPTQPSYSSTITPIYAATDNGLYVFNGSTWIHYTSSNSGGGLASDEVNSVSVEGSGSGASVFCGTSGGLSYYDGSWETTWTTSSGLGSDTVNNVFYGYNLFAATSSGISVYNSYYSTWTSWLSGVPVTKLFNYGVHTYAAAGTSGLYLYNSGGLQNSYVPSSISIMGSTASSVNAVSADSYLDIIIGTDVGLCVLYSGSSNFTSLLSGVDVNDVYFDDEGSLYVAAANGVYLLPYYSSSWTHRLNGTEAFCIYADGAGVIYAGTADGLRVSSDGGSSWTTSLSGEQVNDVVTTAPLYSF